MRVLVACERSGIMRDAFIKQGHSALSCDLLPSDAPGPHYQGDVRDILDNDEWDLLIAHPDCTFLCNSGVRWLYTEGGRWDKLYEAAEFFKALLNSKIPRRVIENPIPHKYAVKRIGRQYDQIIHPWQHGHPERKATCLWLCGVPPLVVSDDVKAQMLLLPKAQQQRIHYLSPGANRAKLRSTTFTGIATAFAVQYGNIK